MLATDLFKTQQPSLQEGIFAATWALDHAIELNPGGIKGPTQIAVLTRENGSSTLTARMLEDDELAEHRDSVDGAKAHLAAYREILAGKAAVVTAVPPTPPPA
jgi:hypothetical protein